MQKVEFIVKKKQELIKAILDELPFLSRYDIKKIIDSKDVKINNVRAKENVELSINDKITVFYTEKEQKEWFTLVYKD